MEYVYGIIGFFVGIAATIMFVRGSDFDFSELFTMADAMVMSAEQMFQYKDNEAKLKHVTERLTELANLRGWKIKPDTIKAIIEGVIAIRKGE